MINAVLFDLDGTLINTNELIIKTFKYVYKKYLNLEVSKEEICEYFGEPLIDTLSRYDRDNAKQLMEHYKQYNSQMHDEMVKGFEGAKETIIELKKAGVKVGVVTSKRREMTERGLRLAGLMDLMDLIITPEDTSRHKPDPEPILTACSILGITPEEVLYVGDTSFDLRCAFSAGAKFCLVKYTMLPLEKLMELKPDYVIDLLVEISKIVAQENLENFVS